MTSIPRLLTIGMLLVAGASALGQAPEPPVRAQGAIAIDADTGKVLWEHDSQRPRYMASTTKIMTALILLEKAKLTDVITAPQDIEKVKESSLHLKAGEKLTVEDMLYGLMLRSANDGCVAVANHVAGSVPAFLKLMNEKAKELGCKHTHFANPNGLHDPNHYTSAADLALIARAAMQNPEFRKVVKTYRKEIARSIDTKDKLLINRNKWLKKDWTADGVKTGFTVPAGHCYVGSATRGGWRVITVLLNTPGWQLDHQNLLNWCFERYERKKVFDKGAPIGVAQVRGGSSDSVALVAASPVFTVVRKGEAAVSPALDKVEVQAPVVPGQAVAATFQDGGGLLRHVKASAGAAVPLAPAGLAASAAPDRRNLSFWIGGGCLATGAYLMRRRSRSKMTRYASAKKVL